MSFIGEILDKRFEEAGEKIYSIVTERILDTESYIEVRDIVIETILTKRIQGLLSGWVEFEEVEIEDLLYKFQPRLSIADYGVNKEGLAKCICHFFKKDNFIPIWATPRRELKLEEIFQQLDVEPRELKPYYSLRNIFGLSPSLGNSYEEFFKLLATLGFKEDNILSREINIVRQLLGYLTPGTSEPDIVERFFREKFEDKVDEYIENAKSDPFTYSFLISIYGGEEELSLVLKSKKDKYDINTEFEKLPDEKANLLEEPRGEDDDNIKVIFTDEIYKLYKTFDTKDYWKKTIERALNEYYQNEISAKQKDIDKLLSDKVVRKRISKKITLDVLKMFARECKAASPDKDLYKIYDSITDHFYEIGKGFTPVTLRNWLQDNSMYYHEVSGKTAQRIREFFFESHQPEFEAVNWYNSYLMIKGQET